MALGETASMIFWVNVLIFPILRFWLLHRSEVFRASSLLEHLLMLVKHDLSRGLRLYNCRSPLQNLWLSEVQQFERVFASQKPAIFSEITIAWWPLLTWTFQSGSLDILSLFKLIFALQRIIFILSLFSRVKSHLRRCDRLRSWLRWVLTLAGRRL